MTYKFKKLKTCKGLIRNFPSNFKDKKGRIRDGGGSVIFDPNQKKGEKIKNKPFNHNRVNRLKTENKLRSENIFAQFINQ